MVRMACPLGIWQLYNFGAHTVSRLKACFFNPVVRAKAHPFGGVLRTYYWCFVASFSSVSCLGEAGRGAPGMPGNCTILGLTPLVA